ncbi:DMT family transporter [Lacihabitans sp. LS3-19]|uniref:DMT family transporter n=1 Tax=Lacihabitans sp. LS3-19 TaxID=2487335 RepID=UPI0020CF285F|nr:DMT family transporter [Lacihabitans sp. LS3-19]MCP9770002.1 DMT family transporter [Lacihabitans sp. LS3-19]
MIRKALANEDKTLISWILLLFLAVVWGLSFILVKKIVINFTAIELGAGRIFIAGLTFLPFAIKNLKNYPKDKTLPILASGLLGYLIPAVIFGVTGSKLNSSLIGTLNSVTPLFVLITGALFFSKKILNSQISGIVLGFVGSLILILSGGTLSLNFNNPYALMILGATLMYGLNGNVVGHYLGFVKPIVISAFSLLFVGSIAFFMLLGTDFFQKIFLPENHLLLFYFIILGALNSGFAAFLYNYVLQISSPVFVSSVTYLIPIVATVAGLFDGESINLLHYFGMAIILIGIYLLNKKK